MSADRVYGTDLYTLMHPGFWGASTPEDLVAAVNRDPRSFWDRVLDTAQAAGVQTLQLTFAPADVGTAVRAYGSLSAFADELGQRGLGVYCSYFGAMEEGQDLTQAAARAEIVERAAAESAALKALGARYLVVGLPAYAAGTSSPVAPELVTSLAELSNRVGEASAEQGLKSALHTEAYSAFWQPTDIGHILAESDPALVGFCPDAGHLAITGADPAAVLHEHRDRYVVSHWKDAVKRVPSILPPDADRWSVMSDAFAPPGSGFIDWRRWANELESLADTSTVILEIDSARDPIAALTSARTYIDSLLGDLSTAVDADRKDHA